MTKSIKMMVYDGDLSSEVWLKLPVGRSFVPLQVVLFEHVGEVDSIRWFIRYIIIVLILKVAIVWGPRLSKYPPRNCTSIRIVR